jgi:hypothetical protein
VGNGESLLAAGFGLGCIRDGPAQQQGALEPIGLREQVTLPVGLQRRQDLGQQAQAFPNPADMPFREVIKLTV